MGDMLALTYRINTDDQFAYITVILQSVEVRTDHEHLFDCQKCLDTAKDAGIDMLQRVHGVDPKTVEHITTAQIADVKAATAYVRTDKDFTRIDLTELLQEFKNFTEKFRDQDPT